MSSPRKDGFTPVLPQTKANRSTGGISATSVLKDSFTLPTLFSLGALLQSLLLAVLPPPYALLPALATVLYALATSIVGVTAHSKSSYLSDIIAGRFTAQIPSGDGSFGHRPAAHPLVLFILGARFNHPLGVLSPGAADISDGVFYLLAELERRSHDFGFLGHSTWRADERGSQNTVMELMHFRSLEGLHAFAHGKLHRDFWSKHNSMVKAGLKHVGIYHETFCVGAGQYESIYVNMPPIMMGAIRAKVRHPITGEEGWESTLVDAISPLDTQYGRLERAVGEPARDE